MTSNLSVGTRPAVVLFGAQVLPKAYSPSQMCAQARPNPIEGNRFHRCTSTCPCRSRSTAITAMTSKGSSAVASKEVEVPMRDYEQSYLAARYFRAYIIQNTSHARCLLQAIYTPLHDTIVSTISPLGLIALNAILVTAYQYINLALAFRSDTVNKSFPGSLLVDDFIHRLEIGLFSYGFNGDNSIGEMHVDLLCKCCLPWSNLYTDRLDLTACTNLCRDEITSVLKKKVSISLSK